MNTHSMPSPPAALPSGLPFINWRSVPQITMPGAPAKKKKEPINAMGVTSSALDPANWIEYQTALTRAGGDIYVGVVLPSEPSGQFLIDLDGCLDPASGVTSPWAQSTLDQFPGCWQEVSHSGTGFHIMGRCDPARLPDLRNKWTPDGATKNAAEFYHAGRMVALGRGGKGDANIDWTDTLLRVVPARESEQDGVVDDDLSAPPADYTGPEDDDDLIDLMRTHKLRAGGALATGIHASDFFDSLDDLRARIHALGGKDPAKPEPWDFDGSSIDMALMNHLGYYTGGDVPRMQRLHALSVMGQRDKALKRPGYVTDTATVAARGKRAKSQYLRERVSDYATLLKQVKDNPHEAAATVATGVAALSAAERVRFLEECKQYGVKTEVQAAVKAAATEARRAETERMGMVAGSNGAPVANMENVRRIMTTSPEWRDTFMLNEFDNDLWAVRPQLRRVTDNDLRVITGKIQSGPFPTIKIQTVLDGIIAAALENTFHPVRDYLASLQWDGAARIGQLFIDYFPGDADPEYLRAAGRKFTIGAVARVMDPGCKVDTMPVISGAQGKKKSSGLAALVGIEWFGDDLPPITKKDAKEWLPGKWLAEIAELSALRGKDVESVKSFLSTSHDSYRKSYGKLNETFPRQTVFAGTTNADEYLPDETGGRRFWPIKLRAGDEVRVDAIRDDRAQLWAEAVAAYRAGEKWWFDESESGVLRSLQESVRVRDIAEMRVCEWLQGQPGEVTASQVGAIAFPTKDGDRGVSMASTRYLRAARWEKSFVRSGVSMWARTSAAEPYQRPEVVGNVATFMPR